MRKGPVQVLFLLLAVFVASFIIAGMPSKPQSTEVATSVFIAKIESKEITEVVLSGDTATGRTAKPSVTYKATANGAMAEAVIVAAKANGASYDQDTPSNYTGLLYMLFPFLMLLLIIWFFLRQAGKMQAGAAKQLTKNKALLTHGDKVKTTFADVEGIPEAVKSAGQLVKFLKDPSRYRKLGAKMPAGYLFQGPSGTGKTLLARAIAGEAGVPFFSMSASEFVEMFVGVGAARVRELFGNARKHAPSIIFIDEIDALAKRRSGGFSSGGHDEREQTLNQILVEMDGFTQNEGVIVIGATNRPDVLDPAVLRPGRFTRKLTIPLPDVKGREKILRVHAKGKPLSADTNLENVAKGTPGMSGAELADILNEGAISAADDDRDSITEVDLLRARDTVIAGEERKSFVMTQKVKRTLAWHEAGHTVQGWFTPECDPIHRVSIIPRGNALGLTWSLPDTDRILRTKKQLSADVRTLYSGRLAEILQFGDEEMTDGAGDDLKRATAIAKYMVEKAAMLKVDDGPQRVYNVSEGGMLESGRNEYSGATHTRLDHVANAFLTEQENAARKLLLEKKDLLDKLAEELLVKETLEQHEIEAILGPQVART